MQRSPGDTLYFGAIGTLAGFTMLLLLAPTAVVLIISFTGGITLKFPPPSWSVRWYLELLKSDEILQPAITSLKVAIMATIGSATLGTAGALGIARSKNRLARLLDALFMSPMVLPPWPSACRCCWFSTCWRCASR
jgi:putative spermidine/putrescine transport system permease protein